MELVNCTQLALLLLVTVFGCVTRASLSVEDELEVLAEVSQGIGSSKFGLRTQSY